jgi:hypothetical protein
VVQVEYSTVLHFDQDVGYEADVDMTLLLLVVMQRLDDHLREEVRMEQVDMKEDTVYELLTGETEGYVVS